MENKPDRKAVKPKTNIMTADDKIIKVLKSIKGEGNIKDIYYRISDKIILYLSNNILSCK